MHIKSLTLSGFKSYKETVVELCEGTTIIVGRNGSGKSNFFDAIKFVLGESHDPRASSRQALLHDGDGGEQIVSAYVEITLDNSDERLPVESNEVTIRRQVGAKKDEYFVNMKKSQKSEINSLLETAGFSKSNPYYIVAQGKIADMSNLNDSERMALLKEVAGTHVYEEKRRETMANLAESQEKRAQITVLMDSLEARLDSLVGEAKELEEFVRLERRRKALEYTLNSGEVARAASELRLLEEEMAAAAGAGSDAAAGEEEEGGEQGEGGGEEDAMGEGKNGTPKNNNKSGNSVKEKAGAVSDKVAGAESSLSSARSSLRAAAQERGEAETVLPRLTAQRVRAAELVTVVKKKAEAEGAEASATEVALSKVQEEVAAVRRELEVNAIPAAAEKEAGVEAARLDLANLTHRQDSLLDKAGRSSRFKSRAERDAHLKGMLEKNSVELQAAAARAKEAERDSQACEEKSKACTLEAEKLEGASAEKLSEIPALAARAATATAERKGSASAGFESKRQADEWERRVVELGEKVASSERSLFAAMPSGLRRGLEAVKRLSNPSSPDHIPGILGPVYELFRPINERYNTAVESIAGNDLFNVVVTTEAVGAAVVGFLLKNSAGRVTLIPLNRVRDESKHCSMPTGKNDCVPLLDIIKMDKEVEPALRSIFGFALLCKNTEVAAGYARSHGVTSVTLDGDKAEGKKGVISGGYIDTAASRLKNLADSHAAQVALADAVRERGKFEAAGKAADATALEAGRVLKEAEEGIQRRRDDSRRLSAEAERKRSEAGGLMKRWEEGRRVASAAAATVKQLQGVENSLREELTTELTRKLTEVEERELAELGDALAAKSRTLASASAAFEAARARRAELESQLDNFLLRRVTELRATLSRLGREGTTTATTTTTTTTGKAGKKTPALGSSSSTGQPGSEAGTDELKEAGEALEEAIRREADANRVLSEAKAKEATLSSLVANLTAQLETLRAQSNALNELLGEERLKEERFLEKKRMVLKRKEDAQNKLREIGTLPSAELDELAPLKRKALISGLGEVNESLKGLSHINKAAAEQLLKYREQYEQLKSRAADLDKSEEAIEDLIDTLDARKDEAIMRTFKGVTNSFREVFKELVPKGSASMTLVEAEPEGEGEGEGKVKKGGAARRSSAAAAAAPRTVDRYTGLSLAVSFTDAKESVNVAGLSGGQRTLVALSLIFAIQRADPAPFYVFDEIDSALDPIHRAAVGALIRKQSGAGKEGGDGMGAQFVLSTFHPEILSYGDEFYGVVLQAKTSTLESMVKSDAVAFVHKILEEERSKENAAPLGSAAFKKARSAAAAGGGE